MTIDFALMPLIIESVSKTILNLAKGFERSMKEISWLIFEIRNYMVVKDYFKINLILKNSSETAHKLDKYDVNNSGCVIWLEEISTHVSFFPLSD